jgi:hypothetical protein
MLKKSVFSHALAASALLTSGAALAQDFKTVPGELIVKLKDSSDKSFFYTFKSNGVELDRTIDLSYGQLFVVKYDENSANATSVANMLEQDSNVEYAEPNFIYEIVKPIVESPIHNILEQMEDETVYNYTPVDAKFNTLWGLHNTGRNPGAPGTAGADVDAKKAWEITTGDRAIKIAVIDTGIDYNHPDLKDQMWTNEAELNGKPGVDDDGNGYVDDIHGYDFANNDGDPKDGHSHGTHCAGTIGASHNSIGVAGVMKDVQFVAIKFLTDRGSGSTEGAIKSVDYATKMNVDLMSNSWGGGGRSQALHDAIQRASDAGIIFTAAAGNSKTNNDVRPHYPSNYQIDNVVSVAATTSQDKLASFSCYGKTTVHIAAPGHQIMSTTKNGGYASYSGTSMATPHVSGVLGLLLAHEGRMPHTDMKERLLATSEPISALRGKTINGGRINAYNLLTDTRPQRNEPKPGQWVRIPVETPWETAHPYADNMSESRTFTFPGAKFVRVIFNKYDLENRYDFVEVKDANGAAVDKVTGSGQDEASEFVTGDTVELTLTTDRSQTRWGFLVEEVEVQY